MLSPRGRSEFPTGVSAKPKKPKYAYSLPRKALSHVRAVISRDWPNLGHGEPRTKMFRAKGNKTLPCPSVLAHHPKLHTGGWFQRRRSTQQKFASITPVRID
jgi:hypothetical protein